MVPDESLPAKETIGDHIYLNQQVNAVLMDGDKTSKDKIF